MAVSENCTLLLGLLRIARAYIKVFDSCFFPGSCAAPVPCTRHTGLGSIMARCKIALVIGNVLLLNSRPAHARLARSPRSQGAYRSLFTPSPPVPWEGDCARGKTPHPSCLSCASDDSRQTQNAPRIGSHFYLTCGGYLFAIHSMTADMTVIDVGLSLSSSSPIPPPTPRPATPDGLEDGRHLT
jgi:hypothetical protein